MISYPNAKINLGLNILSKRKDSLHNIKSFFLPIPLYDILEVKIDSYKSKKNHISYSGLKFLNKKDDLLLKVYHILNKDFKLPKIKVQLHKNIPFDSGLGGGSSDATFMLLALNNLFNLKLNIKQLIQYASLIGSDCPFFIFNTFSSVSGFGDKIKPIPFSLKNYHIVIIKPNIQCSTKEIFSYYEVVKNIKHFSPIDSSIDSWSKKLVNDLEKVSFSLYPELYTIKDYLYSSGAIYASMSGSGSSVYGLFKKDPHITAFRDYWIWNSIL